MFRTLLYPSSGACDCVDELPHRSSCSVNKIASDIKLVFHSSTNFLFVYNRYAISHQQMWLQHLQRMDRNRIPKQALQYKSKLSRNIGRPSKRWKDQLHLKQDTHTQTHAHAHAHARARLKRCESDWHRSIPESTWTAVYTYVFGFSSATIIEIFLKVRIWGQYTLALEAVQIRLP